MSRPCENAILVMLLLATCSVAWGETAPGEPGPVPLCWKGFKEARFLREVYEKKHGNQQLKRRASAPILLLRFKRYDEANHWQQYDVIEIAPAVQSLPPQTKPTYTEQIATLGDPWMFGVVSQPGEADIGFRLNRFMHDFPAVPVLPRGTLKEGDQWRVKVPPVPLGRGQLSDPRKGHSWLRQQWTDTVQLDGYRCARIEYSIRESGRAGGDLRETFKSAHMVTVEVQGEVYFALEEGIPVLERSSSSAEVSDPEGTVLYSRQMRKRLLLVCREPLKQGQIPPMTEWNYSYRLGQEMAEPAYRQPKARSE